MWSHPQICCFCLPCGTERFFSAPSSASFCRVLGVVSSPACCCALTGWESDGQCSGLKLFVRLPSSPWGSRRGRLRDQADMAASVSAIMAYRVSVLRHRHLVLGGWRGMISISNVMKLRDQTSPAQRDKRKFWVCIAEVGRENPCQSPSHCSWPVWEAWFLARNLHSG